MSEPAYLTVMIDAVAGTIPNCGGETAAERTARFELARMLVMAFRPQDALEASLAARTIATHFAVMDCYARATQPGLCPKMAARLRRTAAALARANGTEVRSPRQPAPKPGPSAPAQVAADTPAPSPTLH